jgi:hypothetical protein
MKTPEQELKQELAETRKAILKLEKALRVVEARAKRAEHAARTNANEIAQFKRLLKGRGA